MSILDRILLILFAIGGFSAAVLICLIGADAIAVDQFVGALSTGAGRVYALAIGIVFGIIAIRFFFYRWGGRGLDFVVLPGEHGHIRISHETFRQMANRIGKSIRGVHEFDTRVANGPTGVFLAVRVRVLPDTDLARMSMDIQRAVKSSVEEATGVSVDKITVNIVDMANTAAKNQRAWVE